jgi:hypothetical protein
MHEYTAPGVYVEEPPAAVRPIAGAGTSTAGFVGIIHEQGIKMPKELDGTSKVLAPAGEPVLVTSWESFRSSFGDIQRYNFVLAHAVYGFFNNGGSRCYVAWIKLDEKEKEQRFPAEANQDAVKKALGKFKAVDEIAVIAVPGATDSALQKVILLQCTDPLLPDRFVVLDGTQVPKDLTSMSISVEICDYAAVYFPWIDVGATSATFQEDQPAPTPPVKPFFLPPSGHIAGIYARVDATRGVHKAPANELIRGALAVEQRLTTNDQMGLNKPKAVNVIRDFDNAITVWGARTRVDVDKPEWTSISTRRLFIYLRQSIVQGTRWAVFEPNGPDLWARIRRNVGAFLTNVWASGALFGDTPEQAFYVRCDETINPARVRDTLHLVIEVGVAVVKPAEFVVFRLSQWEGPTT